METKLSMQNVGKVYKKGHEEYKALGDVTLDVKAGEFVAVVGPSGSGKSTFLSIAGALLSPSAGKVLIDGQDVTHLSKKELNHIRLNKIGFVFQFANLIPYLNVMDQLLLVAKYAGQTSAEAKQKAKQLLEQLDLSKRLHSYSHELSGGERQRVAIARAFMNDPDLILADEPTASLDSTRGRAAVEMLSKEAKKRNKAAIMVTHDERTLDVCDRVVYIQDGKLYKDYELQQVQ